MAGPGKIDEYNQSLTPEERKANARKAGKAPRPKSNIRNIARMINAAPAGQDFQTALAMLGLKGVNVSNAAGIALAVFQAAINGDMKAVEKMWETAVREAVQICGVLGQLYSVPNACEVEKNAVSIDWGNGILYDEDKTWADYMGMVSAGMLKPEIALGWRFGMPVETKKDLAAIRAKYMPTLTQLADGDG